VLSSKPAHLQKQLDLSDVSRKKAFLGYITSKVRNKAITQIPNNAGIVIDIATGNGLFLIDLENNYFHSNKLIGLDLRYSLLREAKQIAKTNQVSNIEWINGDGLYLPLKTNSVEVVLCLNTFLNIGTFNEVALILSELIRICKPGGTVIFDIRNRSNLLIAAKYFLHSFMETFATSAYNMEQFKKLLPDWGVTLEDIAAVGFNTKLLAWDYILTLKKTTIC
jgi:ubiquinone/menaquinone biosynthesis C-methylase UbiE